MKTLNDVRINIDEIDSEIIALLEKRYALVEDVIQYKIAHKMDVFDPSRESVVLDKVDKKINEEKYSKYIKEVFKTIMDESKEYQVKILNDFSDKK